ncbi:MFS transporter [Haladaptatus sp. DJG-WS-42]|uniref:MFS transporter n=1 Tax=Haladaptatus sp. DJG-WS-42 TaxID=3120516 RepID=UPI0030CF3BD9
MVLGTDRRVLVLALARMADAIGNSFLIIVLPLYLASDIIPLEGLLGATVPLLGITVTTELLIGVLLSLFGFLNSFAQPFTGRLSDRTGKRRIYILFGLVLLGAASAAYVFAPNYETLVLLRALQGLGAAFTIPVTIALVNELATTESRGGNLGVFNTFRLIGFGFGPIIAGLVVAAGPYSFYGISLSGFDAAFYAAALGAFISVGLVTAFVADPEKTGDLAADDLSFQVRDPTGRQTLDPVFALGVATLFMGISIALFATLQENVNTRLGQDEFLFSIQFAAVIIANVLLQVPIGRASDQYGRRPFLLGGFLLLAPAVFVQGIVTTPLTMIVARLIHGVAVAMVFAPGLAVAGDLAKEGQSGTTLSVLTMAFGLGTAIGPLASGYLVRFSFLTPFAFSAVLAVVALALVYSQVEETLPA